MVVKNMDIWATSGNNTIKSAPHYTLLGNHIITTVQVKKFTQKEFSLHLNTSLHNNIINIDEYK